MRLSEVIKTEKESEGLFRKLVMQLTRFADRPFKKEDGNEWHLVSGEYRDDDEPVTENYISAHLINDEGENYVDLTVIVPDNEKARSFLQYLDTLRSTTQKASIVLSMKKAVQRYMMVYDL